MVSVCGQYLPCKTVIIPEREYYDLTVRLDKVNQALAMFGKEAVPGSRRFQLSKAYDMLPVNVIMELIIKHGKAANTNEIQNEDEQIVEKAM